MTPRLGEGGTCLAASTMAALTDKRVKTCTVVRVLNSEYGSYEKKFVEVYVHGAPHLADYITGTLYRADTGVCLSSTRMSITPVVEAVV